MPTVKNWSKFQHFKDRKPPWIKLYRDLLDDIEWHDLSGDCAKVLVMLWLIASEDDGNIPSVRKLAFRLRMGEKEITVILQQLTGWIDTDDIEMISKEYQDDAPETETETEKRQNNCASSFNDFWSMYPKKKSKGQAEKTWKRINKSEYENIMSGLEAAKKSDDWLNDNGKFIPYPATWLNARGWEDEIINTGSSGDDPWAQLWSKIGSVSKHEYPQWDDPKITPALNKAGSWMELCGMTEKDAKFNFKPKFLEAYGRL